MGENNFLHKNFILNGLADKSAKEIWGALYKKNDRDEANAMKYAMSRYLKFQMTDDKSLEEQSHELQLIAHEIIIDVISLDEQFQVAIIIDKLTPRWKKILKNIYIQVRIV